MASIELLLLRMIRVDGVLGEAVLPTPLPPISPPLASTSSRPESKLLDGVTFRWKGLRGRVKVLDGVVGVEGEGTDVGRGGSSSVGDELSSDKRRGINCR